jgi:hypothetical protein
VSILLAEVFSQWTTFYFIGQLEIRSLRKGLLKFFRKNFTKMPAMLYNFEIVKNHYRQT